MANKAWNATDFVDVDVIPSTEMIKHSQMHGDLGTGRGATYVVAANDSLAHEKAQADYVCGGAADNTEVQAAIDAANAAGGGSVRMCAGNFVFSAHVELKSNVDVFGSAGGTVITIPNSSDISVFRGNAQDHISVSNLRIEGNGNNQGTAVLCGVWLVGCNYFSIHDLYVNNVGNVGSTSRAIHPTSSNFGQVYNNIVIGGDVGYTNYGMSVWQCNSVAVYGNQIKRCGHQIAFVGDITTQCTNCSAVGNQLLPVGVQNGFQCYYCDHLSIADNTVEGTTTDGDGIRMGDCEYVTASGNVVRTMNIGMKNVNTPYTDAKHTIFGNNIIEGCKTGIYISGEGIILSNNVVMGTTTEHGISIHPDAARALIDGNLVVGSAKHNIYASSSDWVQITNNRCMNSATGEGIRLDNATYCLVDGNYCHDDQASKTQQHGVREYGTSDYNTVINNFVYGNTGSIHTVGANTIVRNNSGFVTENSGTDTVTAATKAVTHGLSVTPAVGDIMITPVADISPAVRWWISGLTSSQFTINLDQAPTNPAAFAWKAIVL